MTTHNVPNNESPSIAVVNAVADANGVDPADLDACLYDHIDPCALDNLISGSHHTEQVSVTFEMSGCRITVDATGTIVVTSIRSRDSSPVKATS